MGDMYGFGTAGIWFVPQGTNQTPVPIGGAQDLTLEVSEEVKEYYGAYKYPLAVARGKGKATGKGKFGRLSLDLMASVLTGSTVTTGTVTPVANEPVTILTNAYTVTKSANFVQDLGVWDLVAGKPLAPVATAPATGQYSVAAGVYTFAAADSSKTLAVSYNYSSAASGRTLAYSNQLMGAATLYSFWGTVKDPSGRTLSWNMPAVVIPKLSFALKNDDFTGQDFEFSAQADASGNILRTYSDV